MPTLINIARAYILRGEAYSALQEHFTEGGFKDYTDGQKCMDRITTIPAADVVERPRWIPVTERLPEKNEWVLCACRANIFCVMKWDGVDWYENPTHVFMSGFVTHWMPLPDPPKEEN